MRLCKNLVILGLVSLVLPTYAALPKPLGQLRQLEKILSKYTDEIYKIANEQNLEKITSVKGNYIFHMSKCQIEFSSAKAKNSPNIPSPGTPMVFVLVKQNCSK